MDKTNTTKMETKKINIWVCTAWHPSKQQPVNGPFIQEQVEILHEYMGEQIKFTVLNPFMPLDIKDILLEGKRIFYDEWYYQGRDIKVYQYQGKIFWHRFPFDINLSSNFYLKPMVHKIIKERGKPDRFWAVTMSGAFVAHAINVMMHWNVPVLLQEHSVPLEMHLRLKWQIKTWQAIRHKMAQLVVTANRQITEFRKQGYKKDIYLLPNPVNLFFVTKKRQAREQTLSDSILRIISVGILEAQKVPFRQIEAANLLRLAGIPFIWIWLGDGSLMAACKEKISAYGLDNHFIMNGGKGRNEIAESLTNSDLFVLSSAYENCPLALIEAQCVGLPCIVHRNDASEKILLPGNGEAINMDDSGHNLHNTIIEMRGKNWDSEAIKKRSLEVFHPKVFAQKMGNLLLNIHN